MIAARFGSLVFALAVVSCGGAGVRQETPEVLTAQADERSKEQRSTPAVRIELLPVSAPGLASPEPRLELLRPTFGEVIASADARRYELGVEVSGFVATQHGQGLLVSLDGRRPRRWPSEGVLLLSDLVREDERIEPGAHVLFGVLVDGEGRVLRGRAASGPAPFFVVDFLVGGRGTLPLLQTARLFCVAPVGTFYGAERNTLRLELFSTGDPGGKARLWIEVPPALNWTGEVDTAHPYLVRGLPPGDLRISARLAGGSSALCEATLNPEIAVGAR